VAQNDDPVADLLGVRKLGTPYTSTTCLWRPVSLPGQSRPASVSVSVRGAVGTNAAAPSANTIPLSRTEGY
jgi:hypothetical protein